MNVETKNFYTQGVTISLTRYEISIMLMVLGIIMNEYDEDSAIWNFARDVTIAVEEELNK